MHVGQYFDRIKYQGPSDSSMVVLRDLHRAHLLSIPFENLDIHRGVPIVLEQEALFNKIVERKRGGFCYELNGSFGWLLRQLGFEVTMLSAAVATGEGGFGPEFDHMALLVQLDEPWLADVGFGDCFLEPVPVDRNEPWQDREGSYVVTRDGPYDLLLQARNSEDWRPQYRFNRQPHDLSEFNAMSLYHQTSPESHFTKGRICTRATENGRVTLSEMRLITTRGATRSEQLLASESEHEAALSQHFDITPYG